MKRIAIFGAGGHAREVEQLIVDCNAAGDSWAFAGYLDDNSTLGHRQVGGSAVLGGREWLETNTDTWVVVAIGSPTIRRKIVTSLQISGHTKFATLIHPSAKIGQRVTVGEGSMICAGAILTVDVNLGTHSIVNIGSTMSHDVRSGDFVTYAPGCNISGAVSVGNGCDIGTNACVIQGVSIGEWAIVGAGAVVVRDIPANTTCVGNPAKVIKERAAGWHE